MAIKVKAIDRGFLGKIREQGDEFEIPNEKAFSEKWMVRLEAPAKADKAPAKG